MEGVFMPLKRLSHQISAKAIILRQKMRQIAAVTR